MIAIVNPTERYITMAILRTNDVIQLTGLSRSTLWRLERAGNFPERIQLGANSVGWLEADINAWLDSRPRGLKAELPNTAL